MTSTGSFLIAGLGSIGRRHLRNLKALGVEKVTAFRTRNLPVEEAALLDGTFVNLDEALCAKPDALFVTNPTSLHIPVALEAAKRGVHLFIEKPLSHNLQGVDDLIKVVATNRLVALVGCNLRWHPGVRNVKRLLEEGAVGRVLTARLEVGEYLPAWHPWEDFRQGYSARSELGGGVILTLIHEFDTAFWCFGQVAEVYARAGALSDLDLPVEDVAQILLTFESGVIAHVAMDYVQWPPARNISVVGTRGKLFWDAYGEGVRLYRKSMEKWETFPHPENFERNDTFLDELGHFLACLKGTEIPLIPLSEGKAVLEVALAAKEAAATGQPLRLG